MDGSELVLTDANTDEKGAAMYNIAVDSTKGLAIEFRYYAGDGNNPGADGISFFLVDGSQSSFKPGDYGGSLGYSDNKTHDDDYGLDGGWLGIGLDEYGNYGCTDDQDDGPWDDRNPAIGLRGSDGKGYPWIEGQYYNQNKFTGYKQIRINLQPNSGPHSNELKVEWDWDDDGTYERTPIDIDLDEYSDKLDARPDTLKFGFAASTGTAYNKHSIDWIHVQHPPTDIQLSNYHVDENEPANTVVGTLSSTDEDSGDTHTYSLEDSGCSGSDWDNDSFNISDTSLRTDDGFDYETKDTYTVCIRTDDGNGGIYYKSLNIYVDDVNEVPTDISLTSEDVDENEPINTVVGTLSSTDPDSGDTHTYSLEDSGCSGSGWDNASFNISGTSLRTSAKFDREAENSYNVCIRTEDSGDLTYDEEFYISVNDEPCDLEITKVVSDPTPAEFWTIVYTVTVTNNGPDHAKDIVVSDTQPSSVTFQSASTTQGPYNIGTGVWDLGDLDNSLSASLIITADVDPGWELEYITNTAVITEFDQADSGPSDNRADRLIVVHGSEFEVIKAVDDCTPHERTPFTYAITLTNRGYTSTAVISDILPISMTYVSSYTTQGNYDPGKGVWEAGMMDIDETQWLYITVYPMSGTARTTVTSTTTITNTAILTDSSRLDPESSNDTGKVFVKVQKANAVEAEITPGGGGLLTYTDTQGLTTTVRSLANAVTDTITLIYTPITVPHEPVPNPLPDPLEPITPGLLLAGHAFDLTVYDCPDCTFLPRYAFTKPVTVTIHYSNDDVAGLQEDELFIACWDGVAWYDAATTCNPDDLESAYDRHPDENWVAVPVCHLTQFALVGPSSPVGGHTELLQTEPASPSEALAEWGLWLLAMAVTIIVAVLSFRQRTV